MGAVAQQESSETYQVACARLPSRPPSPLHPLLFCHTPCALALDTHTSQRPPDANLRMRPSSTSTLAPSPPLPPASLCTSCSSLSPSDDTPGRGSDPCSACSGGKEGGHRVTWGQRAVSWVGPRSKACSRPLQHTYRQQPRSSQTHTDAAAAVAHCCRRHRHRRRCCYCCCVTLLR